MDVAVPRTGGLLGGPDNPTKKFSSQSRNSREYNGILLWPQRVAGAGLPVFGRMPERPSFVCPR
eukprot:1609251-Lingulodinium_polyedra.AAC.1